MVLAIAMMASLGLNVFAADPDLTATGSISIPTIDVAVCGVPEGGAKIFVNPYGFELKLTDATALTIGEQAAEGTTTTNKVFSPTYWLENNTVMALDVYVNGVATINSGSTMTLAKLPLTADSTKKEALIYCAFGTATIANGAAGAFTPTTPTFNAETPGSNFLIGIVEAKTPQKVGTLAGSESADAKANIAFQFQGSAVAEPKEAWDTTKDGISVNLFFTYKPAAA
jgi:hypothetical protein